MSGEKRPAQAAFGSANQLVVKRNKPDAELNPGTAVVKGSSQSGALVQSVRLLPRPSPSQLWDQIVA
jgi:Prp8 binding protein